MPTLPEQTTPTEREPYVGLRLRLWLACISGGAVAGLGTIWVLGTRVAPGAAGAGELQAWLAGVAFAAVALGMLLALWLDHHVVGHLRGLLRGLHTGRVAELRGLPSAAGWGELSELTDVAQALLVRQRQSAHAGQELEQVRAQLATLQAAAEQWVRSEVWEAPAPVAGPLAATADALARGFARRSAVDEQNAHAARQVAGELAAALADATESAEQAERGFVEATAMLTTVRELQRLSGELQTSLGAMAVPATTVAESAANGAREAIESLVEASSGSVEAIGLGLMRVQDISALVQQLANRATLVAIHTVTASHRTEGTGGDLGEELKQLVYEVREATDRTTQLAFDVETAVAEAGERMRGARERALEKLGEGAAPAPAPSPRAYDDSQRLFERVREMVQDAARKGERLSAAGERASRAAERLARRVAEETSETQALVVRLTPVGSEPPAEAPPPRALRLLEDEGDDVSDATPDQDVRGEERP